MVAAVQKLGRPKCVRGEFVSGSNGFGQTIREVTGNIEKNYTYRADGKLSSFQSENLLVSYLYDGLDRLVAKKVGQNGIEFVQSYIHQLTENKVLLGNAGMT